ncbi:phage tail tape measure protein [Bacillus sp. Bva_UNVM-123]|uniref:phage tail tape measure protein n=1 Tax=Bacillus sp. Bva_UNVM-123 TaxID=2829798 RepID=UPI00391F52D1
MAGENLKILITGSLNVGSTLGEINNQIKALEKKINSIKLSVQIDEKISKTLQDFSRSMENHKKITQDLNRVIKEEKTVTREADGVIKEKIRQHLKSGEIIEKEIKRINEQTKTTQKQTDETRKLIVETDKLKNKQRQITKLDGQGNYTGGSVNVGDKFKNTTLNYNANNEITGQRTTENLKQQVQAVENLKQKLLQLSNTGTITNSSLGRMTSALNAAQTEKELLRIEQVLNRIQNSSKSREKTKELEHQLKLYQQQAQINAQNLNRRYGSSLGEDNQRAINNYLQSVNRLTSQTPNLNRQMQQLSMQFRSISSNVNAATSHVLSFGQQLQVAMQRIPLWSMGMASWYLPIRGMKDALQQIVEIDSQLTVIERVSNGQADINEVFQESIRLATELGNRISQVNEGMITFARSGFRGQDLYAMSEVATLMSNVSDLSVEESASSIIAAIKGFGIEASKAITIVDRLNEIDNNFAISTLDLSQVLMKATGAANTFGVSMEAMLGHATAIGQVSRESGNILGNSLKTIYSRITTMDKSIEMLESVGVSVKDMAGEMRPVEHILDNLSERWNDINSETQQMIGLQLAGRFQLSRFLILMQQQSESLKARSAALNSEGSAYKENERFLDSYQAKLNSLSNSWTTLSTTMGEKVLGSGIVVVSESLMSIAHATSFVIDKVGLLPPLFTIAGAAFLALNNHTRSSIVNQGMLATSLIRTGDSMSIATGRSRILQTQLYNLTLAGRATAASFSFLGKSIAGAFTFLSRAFVPLAIFTAVGAGISYITNKVVEHQQEQKKLREETDKLVTSYKDNEMQIQSLVSRYEQLDSQVKSGNLVKTDEEYLKVQQELYTLLPSVAESVDEKGQAHLRSASAIREELGYLKELSRVDAEKFITNFQSNLSELNDKISETQNKLNEIKDRQNNNYSGLLPWFGVREKAQLDDMANSIIGRRDIEAKLDERKRLFQGLGKSYAEYYGVQSKVTEEDQKHISAIVEKNAKLLDSKNGIKQVENEVKAYIGAVGEIRSVSGNLFDTSRIQTIVKYNQEAVKLFNEMSTEMKNGNQDWDKYSDKLEKAGFKQKEISSILNLLKTGKDELTGATLTYIDASEEMVDVEEDKISATKKLIGINSEQLDSMYELIGMYKLLSELEADSTEKSAELQSITEQLASAYPHLVKNKQINIKAIEDEVRANDVLLKATDELLKGTLTTEQAKTTTTAIQAKKRIDILKQELAAQNQIVQKFNEMSKTLSDNANTLEQEKLAMKAYDRSKKLVKDIDIDLPDYQKTINDLANSIDYQGRNAEAIKKSNKEYENSIYISDKFKAALEKLNAELEKQKAIQAQFPKHSQQYQSALKNEISLMQQKKQLLEDQTKSLNEQIRAGKIQSTGKISNTSSTSSTTTPSGMSKLIAEARKQSNLGTFTYKQVGGEFTGTYKEFLNRALSDCSQFAQEYFEHFLNIKLPRTAAQQWNAGTAVKDGQQQVGDLVFWNTTGKTNSHVGIYTGNGKAMQMGLSGLKEINVSDIKGFEGYRRIVGATDSSISNGATGVTSNTQESIDQAKSELLQLQGDVLSVNADIQRLQLELVKAPLYQAEHRFSQIDSHMKIIESNMSKMDQTSKAYRQELNSQVNLLNEKKKITEQNMAFIENELKKNKALTENQKAELQQTYRDLRDSLVDLEDSIYSNRDSFLNSALDGLNKRLDESNQKYIDQIEIIEHLMDVSVGNEDEQIRLQGQKISLLNKQKSEIEANIRLLESQNKNLVNNKAALEKNVNETKKWRDALMGVEKSIQSIYSEIADKVINAQKDFYREKLNAELDALEQRDKAIQESYDKERKLMEDNHKREMDLLDEELKQYQKIIQAKLDSIDKTESERDYNKELEKLSAEKLKIESEKNKLALDNSFEAIAKKIELEEQLRDKVEQIEELKHKREVELRKNSLQDELNKKQEEIENAKKALDKKQNNEKDALEKSNKNLKDSLEADKKAIQSHYDNIINDERKWATMREDIMKGNINNLTGELIGFSNDVNMNMSHMGNSIKNNLIDKLKEAIDLLQEFSQIGVGSFETGISKPNSPSSPSTGGSQNSGNQNTGSNNQTSPNNVSGKITIVKPINLWKRERNSDKLEFVKVLKAGEEYKVYGYDDKFGGQYDVGGNHWITNMPEHIKLKKYHDGGIVGGKGNRLTELANKLFNSKPNEQTVLALKNELFAPEKNMPNFFNNIGNLVSSMTPSVAAPQGATIQMDIHIENMNGTKADVTSFFKKVTNEFKGAGVIIK